MKYEQPKKAKVHAIKASALWKLLLVGLLMSVLHWLLLEPLGNGRGVRLPKAFEHRRFIPPIIEYNKTEIWQLANVSSDWASDCPAECGASRGWGICDGIRCVCYKGMGGSDCGIGIAAFYGDHRVYHNLTIRPLDVTGWDLGGDLYKNLILSLAPNLVVEIGVWKGASALKLAKALKEQGTGVLLAVDTWLPLPLFWADNNALELKKDLRLVNGYPTHYYTFLSNVVHLNLTDVVIPLPAMSRTAYQLLKNRNQLAELVHIDGGHAYEEVSADIRMWWSLLRDGGILLGDDWSLVWPGVLRAVRDHAERYRLKIHVYRSKWWLYKPKVS